MVKSKPRRSYAENLMAPRLRRERERNMARLSNAELSERPDSPEKRAELLYRRNYGLVRSLTPSGNADVVRRVR